MLAVIAPSQPVAAVLAAPNECCLVAKPSSLQQQHKEPAPVLEAAPAQQWDAVATTQVLQQPVTVNGKPQMGVLQLCTDQGTATTAAAPAGSPATAAGEPGSSTASPSTSVPGRRERRSSRTERRPSRSERKAAAAGAAPVAGYSTDSYWNSRYAEKSTHFDWFYNYSALAELIGTACDSQAGPCLHVGCGNSGFSEGMVQDGFEVVNVDISPVVIEQMRIMDQLPGQKWEVADCRSMPQYGDGSFGSVLDKGTLDAVLCSSHGTADAASYINEVHRLLAPGGVFLLISLGQPHARLAALKCAPAVHTTTPLPYLSADLQQRAAAAAAATAGILHVLGDAEPSAKEGAGQQWEWEAVEVYLLPKPSLYLASESSLTGKPIVAHMRHSDKDMPVEWLGPFKPGADLDAFIAQQTLDLREFFTAFACTKPAEAEEPGA